MRKKLTAAAVGVAVIILVQFLGMDEDSAQNVVNAIAAIVGTYTLGQGIADIGKEKVLASKNVPTATTETE